MNHTQTAVARTILVPTMGRVQNLVIAGSLGSTAHAQTNTTLDHYAIVN